MPNMLDRPVLHLPPSQPISKHQRSRAGPVSFFKGVTEDSRSGLVRRGAQEQSLVELHEMGSGNAVCR